MSKERDPAFESSFLIQSSEADVGDPAEILQKGNVEVKKAKKITMFFRQTGTVSSKLPQKPLDSQRRIDVPKIR
jgi:hypothetical protein